METAQTRQNAAPDPAGILPLDRVPRREDADARAGVHGLDLLVEAAGEADEQRRAADDDDVLQQVGPVVGLRVAEPVQRRRDQFREGLLRARARRFGVLGVG